MCVANVIGVIVSCSAACTGAEQLSPSGSPWVEPGWMATMRQQTEEFETTYFDCIIREGATPVRMIGGGVALRQPADAPQEITDSCECSNAEMR